jgi:hypothetical protein
MNDEEYGISEQICGRSFLIDLKNNRRKVSLEKRKWRKIMVEDTPPAVRRKVINKMFPAPSKADADDLELRGLKLLDRSRMPCPPLPCGADVAWMDQAVANRLYAFSMIDAAAVLRARPHHQNAPNLHAFDEEYFSS